MEILLTRSKISGRDSKQKVVWGDYLILSSVLVSIHNELDPSLCLMGACINFSLERVPA